MTSRRDFFKFAGIAGGAVAASSVSRAASGPLSRCLLGLVARAF